MIGLSCVCLMQDVTWSMSGLLFDRGYCPALAVILYTVLECIGERHMCSRYVVLVLLMLYLIDSTDVI